MADHSRVLHGWSTAISTDGCRSWHTSRTGGGCRGCGRRLSERKTRLSVSLPGNLGPAARGYIDSPGDTPVRKCVSGVLCEPRGQFAADDAGQADAWSPAWSLPQP